MNARSTRGAGRLPRRLLSLAALGLLVGWTASGDYADSVFAVAPGPFAAGATGNALGPPTGQGLFAGSVDTYTLGIGGSITLGFSSAIQDAAGTDFIVCENPFYVIGSNGTFVEAMFVEVSSDGVHYARFPTRYSGATGPFPRTAGIPPTWFDGFAGVLPVSGNPALGINPLDVVAGGGDAFDLADLADDPDVLNGNVDLHDIGFVRLVDVNAGVDQDSHGTTIWDCGLDAFSSADVDAVVSVNSAGNAMAGRPRVELTQPGGALVIRIEDDNGIADVKAGLTASVNGFPVDFYQLLPFFQVSNYSAIGVTLSTPPIPPGVVTAILKVSARDHANLVGGDAVYIP